MTKFNILQKPLWSLEDIQYYFEVGRTTASKMMQAAKKVSLSRFAPSKAKRDILFEINGLSFKEELRKMQMLEGTNGGT